MARHATGVCSACGHFPMAFDAVCCPRCGAQNPQNRVVDRLVGRGMLFGLLGGVLAGGVYGWVADPADMAGSRPARVFAGALIGGIPGLIIGMIIGLILVAASDVLGWFRKTLHPGGLVNPLIGTVFYCGHCRTVQTPTEDRDCQVCGRRTVAWNPARESETLAQSRWDETHDG